MGLREDLSQAPSPRALPTAPHAGPGGSGNRGQPRSGRERPDYSDLPSVREILLVSSQERRAKHWRRGGAGDWTVRDLIGAAELRLETIDATIPLAAVYENVAL